MKTRSNKNKLVTLLGVIVVTLVFSGVVKAAFNLESWQNYRDISISPSISSQGFTKVVLPDDIYADNHNFADIRIITNGSTEVPYFLTRNATIRGGTIQGRILDQTSVNGSEQFIVDMGRSDRVYTGISIDTSARNYRCQVSLYSAPSPLSLSDTNWNIITSAGYIFKFTDPSSGYSSGKNFIDFSAHTSRYIKVVISGGDEGPVNAMAVNIYSDRKIDVPSYSNDIPVTVFNNPDNRSTEVIMDLGKSGKITDAVTLNTTDKNYVRRVLVYVNDATTTTSWKLVGQGSISGVSTSLFSGYANRVTYPEQNKRYIKLAIVNDDNRPLALGTTVLVEGPVISLIFETRAGENYKLYYGNPKAQTPTYDLTAISSYIEENALPQSSVGTEIANPQLICKLASNLPSSIFNASRKLQDRRRRGRETECV